MIWNIFKKDFAQLWLLSLIVATLQLTSSAFWFVMEPFNEPQGLVNVADVFAALALLGNVVLIVSLVHQDVLPGVSQDWLIRPIRRSDLLLSKLLFLVVVVQVPMLLADIAHASFAGFSFPAALAAAASRNLFVLLSFNLPAFAIAAVTRNLVQVAAAAVLIWLVVVIGVGLGILAHGGSPPIFAANGIQWMTPAFWSLLAMSAAAVVIPFQYFRRSTTRARGVLATAVLLAPMLSACTWAKAFSLQERLSPKPALAKPINIAFDPDLGKSAAEPDSFSPKTVILPVRVSGLPPGSFLMSDHAEVRVFGRDGAMLYRGRTIAAIGYHDDFPVRTTAGGEVRTHQRLEFPDKAPDSAFTQPVRLEIDYSVTLFNLEATDTMPALNGDRHLAAFGHCRTKLDNDGDDIGLGCENPGAARKCIAISLENPTNGLRDPEYMNCDPDYAPYAVHVFPDIMSQSRVDIRFRDLQGLAKYPVDRSQLGESLVSLQSYSAVAHFARRLVIPEIRLDDWTADAVVHHAQVR